MASQILQARISLTKIPILGGKVNKLEYAVKPFDLMMVKLSIEDNDS